jgi:hypothetical protein
MRRTITLAASIVVFVIAALGAWLASDRGGQSTSGSNSSTAGFAERFSRYDVAPEPNGDLKKVVWPDYVLNSGSEVKRLYEFQVTHGDLMRYMPCFCGCGQNAGHRNNRDCYIRRVNANGSVVFDPMAPT